MADYWGVELVHPELKNQEGVSLILTQSIRGAELFETIKENCVWGATDCKRATTMNHATLHSPKSHVKRDEFFANLDRMLLEMNVRKSLRLPLNRIVRNLIITNGSRVKKILRYLHFVPQR